MMMIHLIKEEVMRLASSSFFFCIDDTSRFYDKQKEEKQQPLISILNVCKNKIFQNFSLIHLLYTMSFFATS